MNDKEKSQMNVADKFDKRLLEKIRRWKVDIRDFKITNEFSELKFDCFLLITIGGNIHIVINEDKKVLTKGSRGFHFSTPSFSLEKGEKDKNDKMKNIERFEKVFEVRDSIFNLFKQDIAIEIYQKSPFYINRRIGYVKKDLKSIIINDSIITLDLDERNMDLPFKNEYLKGKNLLNKKIRIIFKCYFQEIYNFRIFFDDWGAENLNNIFKKNENKFKTKLEIKLLNLNSSTSSTQYNYMNEINELNFDEPIYYKGSLKDLDKETLEIKILKNDNNLFNLCKTKVKTQYFPLRSVYSNSYFKKRLDAKDHEEQKTYLWGKVTLDEIPKYTQKSIASYMTEDSIQLCFNLKKIIFAKEVRTRYIFLSVEINGTVFQTQKIDRYLNNSNEHDVGKDEIFYFFIDKKEELDKEEAKRKKKFQNFFKNNSTAEISVWAEDSIERRDFLGKVDVSLRNIIDKQKDQKTKEYQEKSLGNYQTYPFEEKKKLNNDSMSFTIEYEMWFYPLEFHKLVKKLEENKNKNSKRSEKNSIVSNNSSNSNSNSGNRKHNKSIGKKNNNNFKRGETVSSSDSYKEEFKYIQEESNVTKKIFEFHLSEKIPDLNSKLSIIEDYDQFFMKNRFFGFYNFNNNNDFYKSTNFSKTFIKGFYVNDQFGNKRIINSFLSKLTIETNSNDYANNFFKIFNDSNEINSPQKKNSFKNNSDSNIYNNKNPNKLNMSEMMNDNLNILQKIKLGIGKIGNDLKSFIHFISCLEYNENFNDTSNNSNKNIVLNSPDFVLKKRKGSIYEHAILLACILISVNSKKKIKFADYDDNKEFEEDLNNDNYDDIENKEDKENSLNNDKELMERENSSSREINGSEKEKIRKGKKRNEENKEKRKEENDNNNEIEDEEKEKLKKLEKKKKKINYKREKYYYSKKEREIINRYGIDEAKLELIEKKNDLDASKLIFVCMGTLRGVDESSPIKKHMWVMSISDDLSEINYYDPFLKKQILNIKEKIKNRSILQWYLLATKMNFQAIQYKLEKIESNSISNRFNSIRRNSDRIRDHNDKDFFEDDHNEYDMDNVNQRQDKPLESQHLEDINTELMESEILDQEFLESNFSNTHTNFLNKSTKNQNNYNSNNPYNFRNSNLLSTKSKKTNNFQSNPRNSDLNFNTNSQNQNIEMHKSKTSKGKKSKKASNHYDNLEETENNQNDLDDIKINKNQMEKKKKNKEITQLPYMTIDCIFNKQNTWINLQNQEDSMKTLFDIWDKNLWYPLNYCSNNFSSMENNKKENNEKKEEDQEENNILINMDDIPAFFSFKDLIKPFEEDKLKSIQKSIVENLKENIRNSRRLEDKKTKFANYEKYVHIFDMFMVLQEMEAMGFLSKEDYMRKINAWREMFDKDMNASNKYKMIPISLNTYDEEKLSDLITKGDLYKNFVMDNNMQKNGKFFTAVKIFEYPNRVMSIRILLVSFYKSKIKQKADDKHIYQITD